MLAFMAIQYATKTARESVSAFRPVRPVPVESEPLPIPKQETLSASMTVSRTTFLKLLKTAGKLGARAPWRESVLTIQPNGAADLTTFDCEKFLRLPIESTEQEPAKTLPVSVCVPDGKLASVLGKLKSESVRIVLSIEHDGTTTVRIEANGSCFTLPAENADRVETRTASGPNGTAVSLGTVRPVREREERYRAEFPATFGTSVSAGNLAEGIERTIFATDTESTRYALGGILFEQAEQELTFAGTDSRRLAVRTVPAETLGTFPELDCDKRPFVVPVSALSIVSDCLKSVPDCMPVAVAFHGDTFVLESERFTMRGSVMEGRFPRYRDVIPCSPQVSVSIDRKRFLEWIETAAVVTNEESRGLDFRFNPDGTGLISGLSTEYGKSAVPVSAAVVGTWFHDGPLSITFDPVYIVDFLKTIGSGSVIADLTDSNTAAVFRVEGETGERKNAYVIMPLCPDR